jgi:phosphoglycolate phosphatase
MGLLRFGTRSFDADLVIFDKDGTLIDFEFMWGRWAQLSVKRLAAGAGKRELESELYAMLGYDPQARQTRPGSPLSIAGTSQLATIAAAVLYRHGIPWTDAEDRARRAFSEHDDLPLASVVRPAGDVPGLLAALQTAGVQVAVITTDHRGATEETLEILGISHLVDHLVSGDDPVSSKPAPDAVLVTCDQLGADPARTAVVGDTMADLLMAERAGAGLRAAVLTGAGSRDQLQAHSDVVLRSIDEITVIQPARDPGRPTTPTRT